MDPSFFIQLFTKLFGEKANLFMSIFMFSQSETGKDLIFVIKKSFETPEGKELKRELMELMKDEENT
jgi:RNase P protein component